MPNNLTNVINKEVANFTLLYTKLHNYHWFVNGPHFFDLHVKLEELYNEAAANIDEMAERLLAIGEKPAATIKEYLGLTTLEEATGQETTDDMIQSVITDFEKISKELDEGIDLANQADDDVTADMMTGMKKSLDKHAWMLRAYLGK
ncbi:DNA starvation/stationary phase protection protein [Bacillus sp. V5-8f]|uniref:Dps family protein n=1 Tax=Bacillus sp. V5-8f TaxID=2053044 RepID=UPI000C75FD07|nr:DNA starvation/stationary phase protection protein [Bacillus sp. V5-8f]PLT32203.1 DNA starvation/stationary phase protection protein [Bacillus sp. V5-8f]